MKRYMGFRGRVPKVLVEREQPRHGRYVTPLDPRWDLQNHSPDGFEWGYEGSGPAQLALALVADATGDDALALRVYQPFKREVVARFEGDEWKLDQWEITEKAKALDEAGAKRLLGAILGEGHEA